MTVDSPPMRLFFEKNLVSCPGAIHFGRRCFFRHSRMRSMIASRPAVTGRVRRPEGCARIGHARERPDNPRSFPKRYTEAIVSRNKPRERISKQPFRKDRRQPHTQCDTRVTVKKPYPLPLIYSPLYHYLSSRDSFHFAANREGFFQSITVKSDRDSTCQTRSRHPINHLTRASIRLTSCAGSPFSSWRL